jgi:lysosomal alpha-mannosidase
MKWRATLLSAAVVAYIIFYSASVDAKLTVHLSPHTHDDVGWLKTVDQYYYGASNSIQVAEVQYILDTVVSSLLANPSRKFIYVEMAFFWRWWREQTPARQADVVMLVKQGRLEFINGGWCMNDEASTHYEAIIDQMTLGHRFLAETFGITPKVAWHIDPFGHSSAQAALFANTGFEAFMFARIDYADRMNRQATKEMEFMWRGSQSLGAASDIFTSAFYAGYGAGYGMPSGFSFENPSVDPIMDDPNLDGYNVQERADAFAASIYSISAFYKTEHYFMPFGADFYFANAELVFKNIDKLMGYIKAHPQRYPFDLIYSTPSLYVEAVRASHSNWTLKTDDLFPYADNAHSYWTGYFTSRPAFKRYERESSGLLQAITRLTVSTQTNNNNNPQITQQIFLLQEALGIAQHHDAVSGTEKQHVANDYAKRLSIGATAVRDGFSTIIGNLVGKSQTQKPTFAFCPLLNESICPSSQSKLNVGQVLPVVFYNSLAWNRVESIQLPVSQSNLQVLDNAGKAINSQIIPSLTTSGAYNLAFSVAVGPLSATTVFVSATSSSSDDVLAQEAPDDDVVLENDAIKAIFDGVTGGIKSIQNKLVGVQSSVSQAYMYYLPSVGDALSTQASGAYIFRPVAGQIFPFGSSTPKVSIVRGIVVQEIRRQFDPYLTQIVRLYNGTAHLEYVDILGPIPMDGTQGKEVITRFTTNINSATNWYTDANGLEMQLRTRNFRPTWKLNVTEPVAGNYFPMNAAFYISDNQAQFTFVTDRSRGVASLASGQVESMLNRACSVDDARGVNEVLNEHNVIISTQYASLETPTTAAARFRPQAKRIAHPLLPMFGQATDLKSYMSNYNTDFSPMTATLPANVQLLSLIPLANNAAILRLHHIYAVREDATLSQPVTVQLSNLFKGFTITNADEYTLTASKKVTQNADLSVHLRPMEIRTFIVQFKPVSNVRIIA